MQFFDWDGSPHELPPGRRYSWRPSAKMLVIDAGKVVLIKAKQHGQWELPGGGVELEESLAEGAKREFFEETGYRAKVISDQPIYVEDAFFYAKDIDLYARSLLFVFLGRLESESQQTAHIDFETEIDAIEWFDLAALSADTHERTRRIIDSYRDTQGKQ